MRFEFRGSDSRVQVLTLAELFSWESGFRHVWVTPEPSTEGNKEEVSRNSRPGCPTSGPTALGTRSATHNLACLELMPPSLTLQLPMPHVVHRPSTHTQCSPHTYTHHTLCSLHTHCATHTLCCTHTHTQSVLPGLWGIVLSSSPFLWVSPSSGFLEGLSSPFLSALLQILSPRVFPISKAISTHPSA
jgi:hypothetical protein